MAVYKEEKTNTWRVIYRYTDWKGERKQSQKRGFKTKREAQAWEREQLNKLGGDLDMSFKSFVQHYKLAEKKDEFQTVQSRIQNYDSGTQVIEELGKRIETDSEFQLTDPPALMSAKAYKQKFVDPLVKKLKEVIKEVFYRYYHALDSYHRLNNTNANLYRENERLSKINDRLTDENTTLRAENKDFRLLRKVFGSQQIDALISQAKEQEQQRKHTKQPSNQRTKRIRNNDFER